MKKQSKIDKKESILDKFGFGVLKTRAPFSKETIAFLLENMEQHKEDIKRGERYERTTTMKFRRNKK